MLLAMTARCPSFTSLSLRYTARSLSERSRAQQSTISIQNVPREALVCEILDLVLAGPIYHVHDAVLDGLRTVQITFYHEQSAADFLTDATKQPITVFDEELVFSWTMGPRPPPYHPVLSRTLQATFKDGGMTADVLAKGMTPLGTIDRLHFAKGPPDKAWISFLNAETTNWAASDLHKMGATVARVRDRCLSAGQRRTEALKNRSRSVLLRGLPRNTTLVELADQIRGGSLQGVQFQPDDGLAYVHFLHHAPAAAFFHDALYRGIVLHGRRLSVQFESESRPLSPNLVESVKNGASRCLSISGAMEPRMLETECRRFGLIERVSTSQGRSTVVFAQLEDAIRAFHDLPRKEEFAGLRLRFERDPCARPLRSTISSIQNAVQSLLSTPR